MPNWCSNSLCIYSPEKFVEKYCDKDGEFSFDRVVPMPDHMRVKNNLRVDGWLEQTVGGSDHLTIEHIKQAKELQNEFFTEDVFDYIAVKPWLQSEEERTGVNADSWYEWNCEHWGTKWDVSGDVKITPEELEQAKKDGVLHVAFDTAWAPPIPVFEKMAQEGICFDFESEEPGCEIYVSGNSDGTGLCYGYDDPPEREEDEEDEDEQDA